MSIFKDIQKALDQVGFVDKEINTPLVQSGMISSGGKEEYEFYQKQVYYNSSDRIDRLSEYEDMATYAEIGSALDIYADDSTQTNQLGHKIEIIAEDKKIRGELEELFFKNIGIDHRIWEIVRTTCLYGDSFYELILSKNKDSVLGLKALPPKTIHRIEEQGRLRGFIQVSPHGEMIEFMPFEIAHFRLLSTISSFAPYGTSVLEYARIHWRQLKLMEDALVVYRITRAPERRVFRVEVGNLPPAEAEQYIKRQMQIFRKKQFVNQRTGQIDWRANTLGPDEDFWVPMRNGQGTEITTLDGASNLGEIDDVKYFKDKIFAALKIPRVWLQDSEGSEERKQNLSQQDIRFSRTIERIQSQIIPGLRKIAIVHLLLRGYTKDKIDNFEIRLTPPSKLVQQMQAEILETQASAAESLYRFGIPKIRAAKIIFGISEEEWKKDYKTWIKEEAGDSYPYEEEGDEKEDKGSEEDKIPSFMQFEGEKASQYSYRYQLYEGEFTGISKDPATIKSAKEYLSEAKQNLSDYLESNKNQ